MSFKHVDRAQIDQATLCRVVEHLWTAGPMPDAYLDVLLMREFGWTPTQVREIALDEKQSIVACLVAEERVQERRTQVQVSAHVTPADIARTVMTHLARARGQSLQ